MDILLHWERGHPTPGATSSHSHKSNALVTKQQSPVRLCCHGQQRLPCCDSECCYVLSFITETGERVPMRSGNARAHGIRTSRMPTLHAHTAGGSAFTPAWQPAGHSQPPLAGLGRPQCTVITEVWRGLVQSDLSRGQVAGPLPPCLRPHW